MIITGFRPKRSDSQPPSVSTTIDRPPFRMMRLNEIVAGRWSVSSA